VNQLIEQTLVQGEVEPLRYIQMGYTNIMFTIIYDAPAFSSPEDPFYKEIIHLVEKTTDFVGPIGDISSFLPVLSFLDIIFRKERKMKNYVNNGFLPVFAKLAEDARKSDNNNFTKQLDLMKEDLGLDERSVIIILRNRYQI
jgi:hypothetical protein